MAKTKSNYPPNDQNRRDKTWKEGRCQRCRSKVPVAKQKNLYRDENGVVKVRKAQEGKSHYCGDCVPIRKAEKERVPGEAKPKAKKAAKKAAKKPAAKKAGKKIKKPAKKSVADPF